MKKHIHVFGASGSGTTTIAALVSQQLGYCHLDTDSYFWLPTVEPFTVERNRDECLHLMARDLKQHPCWVLSGAIANWGNALIPYFDLAVFVYVPPEVRLERLSARECARYGEQAEPGGSRYQSVQKFLNWAATYDSGTQSGRSLSKHTAWFTALPCATLRVDNHQLEASVAAVVAAIQA